jgi:hypothetical protein
MGDLMRIALTAIILITLTTVLTLGTTQLNQPSYPLKDIENAIRKNPSWVPKNLFPGPNDPIVVSEYHSGEYRFTLRKQSTLNSNQLVSRLNSLRESALYKSNDFHEGDISQISYFTRAVAIDNTKPPMRNKYHMSFDIYDKYEYKGKNTIFFPYIWKSTLNGETVIEIWVEFSIGVSRRGFPILPSDEEVRPIALRTSSGIYLVVLTKRDPKEPRKFDAYESYRGDAFNIVPSRNSKRDTSQIEKEVRTNFLQSLRRQFSSAPFHAEPEDDLPDEVIMGRNYKQNELLNNKYEQSGYVIRVFGESNIGVFIRFSVLTANHPRNKFYDPTAQEFSRYREAVKKAEKAAREETCNFFRGRQEGSTCTIRSR